MGIDRSEIEPPRASTSSSFVMLRKKLKLLQVLKIRSTTS